MGQDRVTSGSDSLRAGRSEWIETFRRRSRLDLQARWRRSGPGDRPPHLGDAWGREHRPDWAARGLLIWPRGRGWIRLEQNLSWPQSWSRSPESRGRLALSWWAERMRLWVDGELVHEGDLFDTACRWIVPDRCREGKPLQLLLELSSPLHDDGALISSCLNLEPCCEASDPDRVLLPEALQLHLAAGGDLPAQWQQLDPLSLQALDAVENHLARAEPAPGSLHWLGHAHLDLAWLWPVADTWQAAERTFRSALQLLQRWPELHFAHSTPALYEWLERHRPALFAGVRAASRAGRWEPINGPWVETDCVLVSSASLWQQFHLGQAYSRRVFPEWTHELAWLPDSFGFTAGLPAVAERTGVRWFCTHKLAWNADQPFPHRLFRWRSRGGAELFALMLPPIGRRGEPLDMLNEQRDWQLATGLDRALWIPGVGDHGGGPTDEMLDQMRLWDAMPQAPKRSAGTVRDHLASLEPHAGRLPVWRDELYLELHRGCATSRPDQKRHNRTLERLLREVDAVAALGGCSGTAGEMGEWKPLLFQQFHDILPGTSIPEVFDQAEAVWRSARRKAVSQRDHQLRQLCGGSAGPSRCRETWLWFGLQPLARWSPLLRLPAGAWSAADMVLPRQACPSGGVWVQLPLQSGISSVALNRCDASAVEVAPIRTPVKLQRLDGDRWRVSNGLLEVDCGPGGLLQLRDSQGVAQLAGPLQLARFQDRGEFWDAWDLAAEYRRHPLEVEVLEPCQLLERGPLVVHVVQRYRLGSSVMRLDMRLQADCPWIELICSIDWSQRHELLRLELPLASAAVRYAVDSAGTVLERPAMARTSREQSRWEVPLISWLATQVNAPGGGLAVLLDGPQGVDVVPERIGVSLLRGPTWPDPGADRGWHRQRLALMPVTGSWSSACVPQAAIAFREPGWSGPLAGHPTSRRWLPALAGELVPVALRPEDDGLGLRCLNPGPSRCRWEPREGWLVSRQGGEPAQAIELRPGELADLRLVQSS